MTGREDERPGLGCLVLRWATRRVAKRVTAALTGAALAGAGGWGAAEATDHDQPCQQQHADHDPRSSPP